MKKGAFRKRETPKLIPVKLILTHACGDTENQLESKEFIETKLKRSNSKTFIIIG